MNGRGWKLSGAVTVLVSVSVVVTTYEAAGIVLALSATSTLFVVWSLYFRARTHALTRLIEHYDAHISDGQTALILMRAIARDEVRRGGRLN